MIPFSTVQKLVTFPVHAAAAVAGTSAGLLATGVRRASHLVGRTAGRLAGTAPTSGLWAAEPAPPIEVPPADAPASDVHVPEPRTAPSAQAAVLAPALGLSEAEVEEMTGDHHADGHDPDVAGAEDR